MIQIIQLILIAVAAIIIFLVLARRSTYWGKAWKKVGLVFLALAMIIVVLFPEITNWVAGLVGVGRGADLLLYLTVVAFILYALNNYLAQQDRQSKLFDLARQVAIMEAHSRNRSKRKK